MYVPFLLATFAFTSALGDLNKGINDPCLNPINESGTCIPVGQCKPINQALTYLEEDAIEFAKQSQCGYDQGPLVCCGKAGRFPRVTTSTIPPSTTIEFHREPSQTASPLDYQHLPDNSLCGLHIIERKEEEPATEITEFPWLAALVYNKKDGTYGGVRCSGTLVNPRYILTAARCLNLPGYDLVSVRLGEWNLSTAKDCTSLTTEEYCSEPLEFSIAGTTAHPYYNTRSGNNDIGLVLLHKKLNYTEFIRPICLPPNDFPPPDVGSPMFITGWNITKYGPKSKAMVFTSSNKDCNNTHPEFLKYNINMACAGSAKKNCNGDSGGPLLRTYKNSDPIAEEQWFQEGIIYKGMGCSEESPALYLRVSKYIFWILNNIKYS